MSIYFTTPSDGNHSEGIGALAQYQMLCYGMSKLLNVKYAFFGFKNLQHYQHLNISQEELDYSANYFFNLPNKLTDKVFTVKQLKDVGDLKTFINKNKNLNENILINIPNESVIQTSAVVLDGLKSHIMTLKNQIKCGNYFDENKFNIAVHIRTYTHTDCCKHPQRELYLPDNNKRVYFENIIKKLDTIPLQKEKIFHIYSQTDKSNFSEFLKLNINGEVRLHINESPLTSLYHMIHSDIFVASNSSLSYVAQLLNSNVVLFRPTFFNKLYNSCVLTDELGDFNIK